MFGDNVLKCHLCKFAKKNIIYNTSTSVPLAELEINDFLEFKDNKNTSLLCKNDPVIEIPFTLCSIGFFSKYPAPVSLQTETHTLDNNQF